MADTCKTCKFWKKVPGVPVIGNCRANPPELIVVTAYGASAIGTRFPQVENVEWCGEWQAIPVLMQALKES